MPWAGLFSTIPTLVPARGGPKTGIKRYMLSVSRVVRSYIRVELFLWVLFCVNLHTCVCMRVCTCVHVCVHICMRVTQHHCPLPEGTRSQYLNFGLPEAWRRVGVQYGVGGYYLIEDAIGEFQGEERWKPCHLGGLCFAQSPF